MPELNKKLILNNTLLLYIRMFLTMGISLFTSRITFNALGVENFGILNIVGGVVSLFTFVNASLTTAISRFFNNELGKKENANISNCYSNALIMQIISATIFFILAEIVGLIALHFFLNIPTEKMYQANWVFQLSILTTMLGFILIVFDSLIISYEKMSFFAYNSLFFAIISLLFAYTLYASPCDKLILISFLTLVATIVRLILYISYVKIRLKDVKLCKNINISLLKQMFSFSGWSLFGSVANMTNFQGMNIVLNSFHGVVVNAALGIANQITKAIVSFTNNFQVAFKPQLMKSYSMGEYKYFMDLIYLSTKISFTLIWIISLPFLINIEFVLNLWLGSVPEYAASFARSTISFCIIDAICAPLYLSVQATGNIKRYQIIVSSMILMNLPLAIVLLSLGFSPEYVLISRVLINIFIWIWRMFYLKGIINLDSKEYFLKIMSKIMTLCILSILLFILFNSNKIENMIILTFALEVLSCLFIYFILFGKRERTYANKILKKNLLIFNKLKKTKKD